MRPTVPALIANPPIDKGASVLAVAAHPDDIDIALGGTIHHLAVRGVRLHYLIATRGEAGQRRQSAPESDERVMEQMEAAATLDVQSVELLDYRDGALYPNIGLRREIARRIRIHRPTTVISHSPVLNFDSIRFSHPDHVNLGQAVMAAVYPDARNPFAFSGNPIPEAPHNVAQLWFFGHPSPTHYTLLSEEDLLSKVRAVTAHASQMATTDVGAFLRSWANELATQYTLPGPSEVYRIMDTR